MNAAPRRWDALDVLAVAVRWFLGAMFIFMGITKALAPVEFLKLTRQYGVFENHVALNFVASTLPWFEVFCGVLLMLGVAVRGAALILTGMLVPFSILIWRHALDIQAVKGLPFCAVKFDCGCGTGEVFVCHKLAQNAVLIGLSIGLVLWRRHRLCLRAELIPRATSEALSFEKSPVEPVASAAVQQRRPTV
jgi:uncharacterized membrane protein YphA (DoxX/SURF4 family)